MGNKRTLIIIIATVAIVFFGSILCCVGGFGGMLWSVASMEKTYYAECEQVESQEACQSCCKRHGHDGNAYGEFINEDGKLCGCF